MHSAVVSALCEVAFVRMRAWAWLFIVAEAAPAALHDKRLICAFIQVACANLVVGL
jgi:hypothetical protein